MPPPELRPGLSGAARATRWAHRAVDVVGGVLCAVVAGWAFPFAVPGWAAAGIVVALAAIGWAVGRRAWAAAFAAGSMILFAARWF